MIHLVSLCVKALAWSGERRADRDIDLRPITRTSCVRSPQTCELGFVTIGGTGRSGGDMPPLCDFCLHAPSVRHRSFSRIHITAGPIICRIVEERLFPRAAPATYDLGQALRS